MKTKFRKTTKDSSAEMSRVALSMPKWRRALKAYRGHQAAKRKKEKEKWNSSPS